jgi:geranylgeranylglycerol-phosphate geranylgeranyltransferase
VRTIWAILQLTRADSSVMAFLCLFLPICTRTKDLAVSFGRSIPLLFIFMCTFIANDLDDLERDLINHPNRPLPSRRLRSTVAALLYFFCLGLALFLTKYLVEQHIAFWYYALVAVSISYGYVIECLPSFKAPYVAAALSIPVIIVAVSYPGEKRLYVMVIAGFLFALGRELCMDIGDRTGDTVSALHRIPPLRLAIVAFVVQTVGLALLTVQMRRSLDVFATIFMAIVLMVAAFCWFRLKKYKMAIRLMKLQLFVGLYFLL